MDVQKLISSAIASLFVSVLIIVFEVTVHTTDVFREMTGGYWLLFETMSILLWPAAPIIYGWITRDKTGSIVVGIVPYIGVLLYFTHITGKLHNFLGIMQLIEGIFILGIVSLVGGLEGYYASQDKKDELKFAILLGVAWILLFIRGIN
ncbi:MAG: hypothetical protein RBT65_11140 [Methanolobus sp.]|jgi:hypothetical protein|nr:hypothetical protein [Methanolobus sp.]